MSCYYIAIIFYAWYVVYPMLLYMYVVCIIALENERKQVILALWVVPGIDESIM